MKASEITSSIRETHTYISQIPNKVDAHLPVLTAYHTDQKLVSMHTFAGVAQNWRVPWIRITENALEKYAESPNSRDFVCFLIKMASIPEATSKKGFSLPFVYFSSFSFTHRLDSRIFAKQSISRIQQWLGPFRLLQWCSQMEFGVQESGNSSWSFGNGICYLWVFKLVSDLYQ